MKVRLCVGQKGLGRGQVGGKDQAGGREMVIWHQVNRSRGLLERCPRIPAGGLEFGLHSATQARACEGLHRLGSTPVPC